MGLSIIVAEFNPLTNGHKYLIDQTKKLFPENKIVVIMSGNFVQRGEPAIIEKSSRTEASISLGVDAVIELPAIFSLSSAEDFAYGAIKIASSFEAENTLIFGSECGDINLLNETEIKLRSTQNNLQIKENLKTGMSFASSQIKAIGGAIEKPNNLLGVMYLKAIKDQNSRLKALTIRREGDYNSSVIDTKFASASAIRKTIIEKKLDNLDGKLPETMLEKLRNFSAPSNEKLFSLIQYKLSTTPTSLLSALAGIKEGIEYRIIEKSRTVTSFEELVKNVSTKRYPESLVRRILMNVLLSVTKQTKQDMKENLAYFRVLGVKDKAVYPLLAKSSMTAITKKKDEAKLDKKQLEFLSVDYLADEIYGIITK